MHIKEIIRCALIYSLYISVIGGSVVFCVIRNKPTF